MVYLEICRLFILNTLLRDLQFAYKKAFTKEFAKDRISPLSWRQKEKHL